MTRDDSIRLALEAGLVTSPESGYATQLYVTALHRFAALVAAHEREACAKVCDDLAQYDGYTKEDCAAAIRERGETK